MGPANSDCIREHRRENRFKIAGGTGDNFEHFGSCDLLLQCFRKIIGPITQLVQEARILDRNSGLICESRDQFDLSLRERSRRAARDHEYADHTPLTQQRHTQDGAKSAKFLRPGRGVFRIGQHIRNVYDPALQQSASNQRSPFRHQRMGFHGFVPSCRKAETGDMIVSAGVVRPRHGGHLRVTQLGRRFYKGIEHHR